MNNTNYYFLLMTILLSTVLSCKEKEPVLAKAPSAGGGRGGPVQVEGFVVRTKALSENLEVPGTLLPFEETEIRPEISGRLVSLNIGEGAFALKGQLLAKLFDEDLQAQLKKLQVQLEIAQKTLERQRELLKINGISQQETDLSELQVNNIRADMELVRVNISKTEIRAPYDGKLGLRNVSLGAYVTPTTLLTTLRQVNRLKLDFSVPEKYGELFPKGKIVNFSIAGSRQNFLAAVLAAETKVESNTRSLRIRALVSSPNPALLPGAFANVSLKMNETGSSLIVPTQAVLPQARNKQVIVFRGGTPQFQVVTTGIRDSSYVEILDGLKAGDTIIITGLLAVRPDSKVALKKLAD